mgnify:CR=1 FL=1
MITTITNRRIPPDNIIHVLSEIFRKDEPNHSHEIKSVKTGVSRQLERYGCEDVVWMWYSHKMELRVCGDILQ